MPGANPASEEVMSLQRPIPSLARPLSRLSPLTLALRWALLGLSAAGAGLLGSGLAHAQSVGQHSAATRLDDATPRSYDIPAGSLGASLGAFASQSDLLLSFDPELTRGRTAPALKGRYSVLEGLQRVLSNTGLQVAAGTSGAYLLVEPRMSGEAPADLSPVVVSAAELADPQKETYTAPRSSVYLSSEDIDRFGRVSVGDLLQGIPGVQVGDSRNGGALDVNIRGIQGQSRVAVRVDGAEQALDVYRGYAGTQQRSYIDPDLVSSVTVDKGPSTRSGAIGGSVEMRTIGVKDILVDGKDLGVRFTGDVWNNGVAPQHRSASSKTENLSSVPHDDRGSLFGSQAKSGSAAFAYRNEHLDLVAAYAQRNQGNYFSGKKGQDRYRVYNRYGREESSVAKVYNAGEEVLNSSSETESYLLKATWRIADEHTLDLGYRRYDGRTGEIMPSDIFRFGTAGIYQYPLSEVKIDTYTARYRYLPENNPLVDLSTGLWMTEAKSDMLTSVLALVIIDRVGRKQLVYWGVSGMIVSLLCIGFYFMCGAALGLPSVFLLVFFLAYIFCCAVSICAVVWVLLSEMYPTRVRGLAMSIAGLALWVGTYLIGQLTPWMLENLTPAGTFFLFAAMCVPYMLIIWRAVPETTGRSLEEIEKYWQKNE